MSRTWCSVLCCTGPEIGCCCQPRSAGDRYQRASLLVTHALHGRRVVPVTPRSMWAQALYHAPVYRSLYVLAMLGLLVLVAWEPPVVGAATGGGLVAVRLLDAGALALVGWDLWLQYTYYGASLVRRRAWVLTKGVVWAAMVANLVAVAVAPSAPYVLRILRPFFLLERTRNVRRVASKLVVTLPRILTVLLLLIVHLLVFAVLGFILFAGIDENNCTPVRRAAPPTCSTYGSGNCTDYFATMENSAVQLFELLTANIFPAIAVPAYQCDPNSMVFFAAFTIIGIFLLLNLTLAVANGAFKMHMEAEVLHKYQRMLEGCAMAFDELAAGGGGRGRAAEEGTPYRPPASATDGAKVVMNGMARAASTVELRPRTRSPSPPPPPTAAAAATATGPTPPPPTTHCIRRDDFVRFYGLLRPRVPPVVAGAFFDVFDTDRRGVLFVDEFQRLLLSFAPLEVRARRGAVAAAAAAQPTPAPAAPPTAPLRAPSALSQLPLRTVIERGASWFGSRVGSGGGGGGGGGDGDGDGEGEEGDRPSGEEEELEALDGYELAHVPGVRASFVGSLPLERQHVRAAPPDTALTATASPHDAGGERVALNPLASATRGRGGSGGGGVGRGAGARGAGDGGGGSGGDGSSSGEGGGTVDGGSVATWAPEGSSSHRRCSLAAALQSRAAAILFDAAVMANVVAVIVELDNSADDVPASHAAILATQFQHAFLALFLAEIVLKLVALGPRGFWRQGWWARADAFLVLLSLIGTILEAATVVQRQMLQVAFFCRCVPHRWRVIATAAPPTHPQNSPIHSQNPAPPAPAAHPARV